MFVIIQGLLLK